MIQILLSLALSLPSPGAIAGPGPQLGSQAQPESASDPARIAWFTDWDQARAEAERSGRPIFLMSAAPRCHDVPGLW